MAGVLEGASALFHALPWFTTPRSHRHGTGAMRLLGLQPSSFCFASPVVDAVFQRSLSLLVSNLFSTSSKAPVPIRAPPEKGWSRTPMVNSTRAITPASDTTISL